jgi:hypothetical protein
LGVLCAAVKAVAVHRVSLLERPKKLRDDQGMFIHFKYINIIAFFKMEANKAIDILQIWREKYSQDDQGHEEGESLSSPA